MAHLIVLDGPDKGKRVELAQPVMRMGRDKANDICVTGPAVSSAHAELTLVDEQYYLRDLGSTNGTTVNGAELDANEPLARNDVISLGSTQLMIAGDDLEAGVNTIRRGATRVQVRTVRDAPATAPDSPGFARRREPRRSWLVVLGVATLLGALAALWLLLQ